MSQPQQFRPPQQWGPPQPQFQQRPRPLKDTAVAYAWMVPSLFLICGVQHFYMGKIGRGLLWLFTFGLFGVGLVIDLFTLPAQVRQVNAQIAAGVR